MPAGVNEGFVDVDGGRLWYEVSGAGEPIVFVHGFSLDARMWEGEAARFGGDYTVLRYDVRGFGRSSLPTVPFAHADDLAALLAHLGWARAHVVGLSMGGGIAVDFALTHPARVRSLVLVDAVVGGFPWPPGTAPLTAALAAGKVGGVAAARVAWLASPLFAPSLARPDVAPRLRAIIDDYSGWHWVNDSPQRALAPPAWQRLGEIAARTLVLVGALDVPEFHAIAAHLVREIPGARGEIVDGAGHLVNLEAPERFAALVAAFLAEAAP